MSPAVPQETHSLDPAGSEWIASHAPVSYLRGGLLQRQEYGDEVLEARSRTIGPKSQYPNGILALYCTAYYWPSCRDIPYNELLDCLSDVTLDALSKPGAIQTNHRIDETEAARIGSSEWPDSFKTDPIGELDRIGSRAGLEAIEIVIPLFDHLSFDAQGKIIEQTSSKLPIRLKLGVGADYTPPKIADSKLFDLIQRDDPQLPKTMEMKEQEPTVRVPYTFTIPLGLTEHTVNTIADIGIRILSKEYAGESVKELTDGAIGVNPLQKFHLTLTQNSPSEITARAEIGLNLAGTPFSLLQRFVNNLSVEMILRNSTTSKVGIETELVLNPVVKRALDLAIRIGKRKERPIERAARETSDDFSDIPETPEGIQLLFTRLPEMFVKESKGQKVAFTRFQVSPGGLEVNGEMDVPEKPPELLTAIDASGSDGCLISRQMIAEALHGVDQGELSVGIEGAASRAKVVVAVDSQDLSGRAVLINDADGTSGIRFDNVTIDPDRLRGKFPDEFKVLNDGNVLTDDDILMIAGVFTDWLLPAATFYLNTNLRNVSVTGYAIHDGGFFIKTKKKS